MANATTLPPVATGGSGATLPPVVVDVAALISTATELKCGPKICQPGASGLFLPLGGDDEQCWPTALRAILYLLGLLWAFMGVGIGADIFMGAIEKITSKKKRVFDKDLGKHVTIKVWNDTIANLSLMALGSSAPEILLNVIGLPKSDWFGGDLGPSTIVGSAAFNLFCIIAVCVSAIPSPEVRYIKETKVFAVTAFSSIFAYVWLLAIVQWFSPDIIEIWEGVLSFLFFFVLLVAAWLADAGPCLKADAGRDEQKARFAVNMDENGKVEEDKEFAKMRLDIIKENPNYTEEQITDELVRRSGVNKHSRAAYRMGAMRAMTGGKRMPFMQGGQDAAAVQKVEKGATEAEGKLPLNVFIEFETDAYKVKESCGTLEIKVRRRGAETTSPVVVKYATKDGTATANPTADEEGTGDYVAVSGELVFEKNEESKVVSVQIKDDKHFENDEFFNVVLSDVKCTDSNARVGLGSIKETTVTILDDDQPGELKFSAEEITVEEDNSKPPQDKIVQIKVDRVNGARGKVSCKYHTEDHNTQVGVDYEEAKGTLTFEDGVTSMLVDVTIKAVGRVDTSDMFRLVLSDTEGGATFPANADGAKEDTAICSIRIGPDQDAKNSVSSVAKKLQLRMKKAEVAHANYRQQFINALTVNGGDDDDEEGEDGEKAEKEPPSVVDWIMHIITIPWKLLFAIIPPVEYCGGWLCFCIALVMIGLTTAFIGDLAELFGCVCGLPDSITAITFVALGTSLPDTFASMVAAQQDAHADASVGNVTGSNSVNVFLGIGLPWMIAPMYWKAQGITDEWLKKWGPKDGAEDVVKKYGGGDEGVFVVLGGSLGFSVILFSCLAVVCLGTLVARRMTPSIGAELGGPQALKTITSIFLVMLWFIFVIGYSFQVFTTLGDCDKSIHASDRPPTSGPGC